MLIPLTKLDISMNKDNLQKLVKEQVQKLVKEEYQDQYRFSGKLITNIENRPQPDILSDIRAIAGVTIVSTKEIPQKGMKSHAHFTSILNLKVDGYPYIKKGGFNRETIHLIAQMIGKVPDVVSFRYSPKTIDPIK